MAPKNTPPAIVNRLSAALGQPLKTEEAKKGFNADRP